MLCSYVLEGIVLCIDMLLGSETKKFGSILIEVYLSIFFEIQSDFVIDI